MTNPRQVLLERREESRIDNQLLFLFDAPLDAPPQLLRQPCSPSFVLLNRRVQSFQQRQTAYIADKDEATGRHGLDRAAQNTHEIVNTGKVLHYGVDNHRVKRRRL